ncbi:MAG: LarC family nickel insertion protein [Chloroflexia bacterium]|nr:LarC family nickel insertion protein [Chloroflexia bacterium]
MQITRVGYGFGRKKSERPNALRVWLGETATVADTVVQLECNIDDQPAEQLAYVCELLLQQGARDVWQTPILMKKGRAAIMLSLLCDESREAALVDVIMRQTSTLGMRRQIIERHVAERAFTTVMTPYGDIRVKHKIWQGDMVGAAPEYADCAVAATQHGVSIHHIYAVVQSLLTQR